MNFADNLFATMKSVAKIALHSRPIREKDPEKGTIVIMGNGPSLNDTIRDHRRLFDRYPTMAVNFAALAPEFEQILPQYYVLADPHFFREDADENLERLRNIMKHLDWPLTLFVPRNMQFSAIRFYASRWVSLSFFNFVGAEGFGWFERVAYASGLAMPRPRNVLVPAIMAAISKGFTRIILVGADHSWTKTLTVTDQNEVVSIQPHFYKESESEEKRIRHDYRNRRLHDVVESFAVAFKSYHKIANFAASKGVSIINATPGSFIDAFERRSAQEILLADYENDLLH